MDDLEEAEPEPGLELDPSCVVEVEASTGEQV